MQETQMREQILKVFERGLEKGFRAEYIRSILTEKGYPTGDIDYCLHHVKNKNTPGYFEEERYPAPKTHMQQQNVQEPTPAFEKRTLIFAGLCVVLGLALFLSLLRQPQIIENIVKVPVEVLVEMSPQGNFKEQLEEYSATSLEIETKQKKIDDQLAIISGMAISMEEKDELIAQQYTELKELNTLMKQERKQVVALLVEVLNYILGSPEAQ